MKKFRICRQAKHISLEDVQKQTGIDIAVLRMFENGQLALTEEQKDALHRLFPDTDKEELFSDLQTNRPSIFTHLKPSPEKKAVIDTEIKELKERLPIEIEEHRKKIVARATKNAAARYGR